MTSYPPALDSGPLDTGALRHALRRWRVLHRVKQADAAARLGVAQSTISRWESGAIPIEPADARRVEALVAARLSAAADAVLAGLVGESPRAVHLVCDTSHRLLACSTLRASSFSVPAGELMGRSLWRFSTPELAVEEERLGEVGWRELAVPPPVVFETGDNGSALVPIRPSRCRWTRLALADGTAVRLVETLGSA
jgi:transcriptional regulator with XRE-family HTH domain